MARAGALAPTTLQPSLHRRQCAERHCSSAQPSALSHSQLQGQRVLCRAAQRRADKLGLCRAVAQQTDAPSAQQQGSSQPETWYALVANSEFMFNDVQNEALAEQLREKKRFYGEQNKDLDFFLVSEPAWLDEKFSSVAKQVRRPCAALVSTDQMWITFMKLRLDRVLKLELTGLSRQEVFQSSGPVPDFTPPEKWTAPYSPYRAGWWEAFMPDKLGLTE